MAELVAKTSFTDGTIDAAVGEPYLIRDVLKSHVNIDSGRFNPDPDAWGYPYSNGYKPLVDFLESFHGGKVVITNGAKQALGAAMYATARKNCFKMGIGKIYWSLLPKLAEMHGVIAVKSSSTQDFDSLLFTAPNNPNGSCISTEEMRNLWDEMRSLDIPMIHDAAYYTPTYLPKDYKFGNVGDIQIFSFSKMFGLPGLRLGYAVLHNEDYLKDFSAYMEHMTVGVNFVTQQFVHNMFMWFKENPEIILSFYDESRQALKESREMLKAVNPDVLEVPSDFENHTGMFGFFKKGKLFDNVQKVLLADGAGFGDKDYVRMNLALRKDVMANVIKRLNLEE
jgi:aspartate/methionine/tyrosine aminotransferase